MHLYVGATGNDLCPIAAVVTYLAVRGMEPGPLFCLQSGQGQVSNEGSWDGPVRILRSLF